MDDQDLKEHRSASTIGVCGHPGSAGSFDEIYSRYRLYAVAIARRICMSQHAAEEVAQEVFVTIWQHPERFDPLRGSLQAYIGTLAHHRAVDHLRQESSRSAREVRSVALRNPTAEDLQDYVLGRDEGGQLRAAVAQLPSSQREVVELTYLGGSSYISVARQLGIPPGTAKSRGRLALKALGTTLIPQLAIS